jgi:hypothetical protein
MQDGMKRKRGGVAIEKKDPVLASQALVAYAETGSLRKAAALTGLGKDAVRGIAERNPEDLRQVKKAVARRHFHIANRCLDELEQVDLSTVPPAQLSVMSGIHTDKAVALTANEPPEVLDYEALSKVIRLHDALVANLARRQLPVVEIEEKAQAEGGNDGRESGQTPTKD